MSEEKNKIEYAIFAAIFLVGLIIRGNFISHESIWPDEGLYLYLAEKLAVNPFDLTDGNGKLFYLNPPFFIYLLSGVYRVIDSNPLFLGHCLVTVFGLGTVFVTYKIGKVIFDAPTALIAAGLITLNPLHVWNSTRVLTDVPLTFFIYLSLYMLVTYRLPAYWLCSILSIATKFPALLLPALPLFNRLKVRSWLLMYAVLASCLFLLVTIGPNYNLESSNLGYFFKFFHFPDFNEIWKEGKYFVGVVPLMFFCLGFICVIKHHRFSAIFHWFCLFGLFRLFLPWLMFRVSRYSLPLYPALLLFSAYGGVVTSRYVRERLPQNKMITLLIASAILLFVSFDYVSKGVSVTEYTTKTFIGYQEAGIFLKQKDGKPSILTSSPRQFQYVVPELKVFNLPQGWTAERMETEMDQRNITHVAIDNWSPHQPKWIREYPFSEKGYRLVYKNKGIFIFDAPLSEK